MTFAEMLTEIGVVSIEAEFRSDTKPPYIVYEEDIQTVCADSVVVHIEGTIYLYLFRSKNDTTSELAVEQVLDSHKIAYAKKRQWLGGSQRVYMVTYEFGAKLEW